MNTVVQHLSLTHLNLSFLIQLCNTDNAVHYLKRREFRIPGPLHLYQ